ncbi:MAG: protein kinase [Anaerolineae bacterium]|nr:protein kinase [Anaerolineae bacterium]
MPGTLLDQTLGERYRFEELLGEGSFAHVYRITDLKRRATLAAKVLRPDIAHDSTLLERFQREAEVLARLQHPNIVRFYDIVEIEHRVFILMDYIPGQTLNVILHHHTGPILPAVSLAYLTPLAAALHFAHSEDIIHRDLKPANILLHQNNTLYVTDFGIARVLNAVTDLTAGTTIGTPFYMAPEQITGDHPITAATDIYALGVLLYRMYTGRVPFLGDSPGAKESTNATTTPAARIAYEHMHIAPDLPRQHNPALDMAIQEVILRCLEKDPVRRYATISTLYDALTEAIGAPPVSLEDPEQTGQHKPILPDMKPPEWSQFIKQVPDNAPVPDPLPNDDTGPLVLPGETSEPADNIPDTQRETEPHLEDSLGPARTLFSLGRRAHREQPPTLPHQQPVTAAPPPYTTAPYYPAYPSEPNPHRRPWGIIALAVGALAVLASLCAAGVYLAGIFDNGSDANTNPATPPSTPTLVNAIYGSQRIAFDSERDSTYDIYVMNVDGTNLHSITSMSGAERGPSWSPDGTKIAYYGAASPEGPFDIFITDLDGTNSHNLTQTDTVDERYPTWSPDGKQLAFHSDAGGDWDIYIINADGSGLHAITENDVDDLGPDWSPEGTQIAYHTRAWSDTYQIAIVDVNTLDARRITTGTDRATFPTWSPDGTQIAFTILSSDGTNIAVINTDGTNLRRLTTAPETDSFPDWSPDGLTIIYQSGDPGESGIFTIPVAGGTSQALTGRQSNYLPEWEPGY